MIIICVIVRNVVQFETKMKKDECEVVKFMERIFLLYVKKSIALTKEEWI